MARTRRRRATKHRGNPAGMVVARGRTGRKPTAQELGRKQAVRTRPLQPPTWRGATTRGLLAAAALFLFMILLAHATIASAVVLFVAAALLYIPATYYFDLWLYRRRAARERGKGPS